MRMYLCCKYGKAAILLPARTNRYQPHHDAAVHLVPAGPDLPRQVQAGSADWERRLWMDSAVCGAMPPLGVFLDTLPPGSADATAACSSHPMTGARLLSMDRPPDEPPSDGLDTSTAADLSRFLALLRAAGKATARPAARDRSSLSSGIDVLPTSDCAATSSTAPRSDSSRVRIEQTGPCPFPAIEAWVLETLASTGGTPARVRAWTAEERSLTLLPWRASAAWSDGAVRDAQPRSDDDHEDDDDDHADDSEEEAWRRLAETLDKADDRTMLPRSVRVFTRLTLCMAGNRFCRRIGRAHQSNNVNYCIDLERHCVWQTCMDLDCLGWRSTSMPVPIELIPDQVEPGYRVISDASPDRSTSAVRAKREATS